MENLTKELIEASREVTLWASTGGDHGGNPYTKTFVKKARKVILKVDWENFGDVPIDKDDKIEIPFLHFPIGTDKYDIWHWFDNESPNGLHELMYPKKS